MKVAWVEPDWRAPGGVRALSTLRSGGVSLAPYASLNLGDHVGDDLPSAVAENRWRLVVVAGLCRPLSRVWLAQVHGIRVADLDTSGGTGVGVRTRRRQRTRH